MRNIIKAVIDGDVLSGHLTMRRQLAHKHAGFSRVFETDHEERVNERKHARIHNAYLRFRKWSMRKHQLLSLKARLEFRNDAAMMPRIERVSRRLVRVAGLVAVWDAKYRARIASY